MGDMRTLEQLQRLCARDEFAERKQIGRPFLRRRGKTLWTLASDAHALIAVKGALTDNVIGFPKPWHARAMFRRTGASFEGHVRGWRPPLVVNWGALHEFILAKHPEIEGGYEPIEIFGVRLNAKLVRKFTRGLEADSVRVLLSPDFIERLGVRTRDMIRFDAPGWSVVVMAALFCDAPIGASFPAVAP